MNEKLTVAFEFSRDQVVTVATLAGVELDQELWSKLTEKPVNLSLNDIDDKDAQLGLMITLVATAVEKI
ncbi:MAG: hypothetical protein IJG42_10630 [Muribaculaceae bacterium]|nr:hypothetical protein [Muribaculaceae bacterium]MBR5169358.1 hypothetical protein [Muribaculaceae bacterium]